MKYPFSGGDVEQWFENRPAPLQGRLLELRQFILDTAASTTNVGTIEETLKWNVPAYLTFNPKSGTTLRIDGNTKKQIFGLYVHCQTTLIEDFRRRYSGLFTFEKNRAILFGIDDKLPKEALGHCIQMALTYHLKT